MPSRSYRPGKALLWRNESGLFDPQDAPVIGADPALNPFAGIRLGDEIQASAALLFNLWMSLVLHACL